MKVQPRLSIVVPTPDGGSLNALRDSLQNQLRDGDEVVLVGDTHSHPLPEVKAWAEAQSDHWRWFEFDAGEHAWGHPQINHGMSVATGDWLMFMDDDDVYTRQGVVEVRRVLRHAPKVPHLFRFYMGRGERLVWTRRGMIEERHIGGHCIVTPNLPGKLGKWTDRYMGDFDFIVDTLSRYREKPIWRQEVIAHAR